MNTHPHSLNPRLSRNFFGFILVMVAILWCYSLFFIPTFDLDESLYRRVAEEMKRSGEWWKPTWDQWPLYHKPPIFYWMIALVSGVVDGVQAPVSIFAARLPSLLASIGILYSLYRFTRNFFAPALFLSAIFPLLTATGVILDPIQTLTLMPTLLIPTGAFLEKREMTFEELLYVGLGMFIASAFKGLNGLVLPAAAFGLHWLLFARGMTFKNWVRPAWRYALIAFLPAVFLTLLYYLVLDSTMGRAFTKEFFLVHHLGRSQGAMESHGGNPTYHFWVIFFGGGFLTTYLIYQWMRVRPNFKQYCFPATYTLTFLLIFSFSATKLPHYTWPVWPAMALMGAILFELSDRKHDREVNRMVGILASFPVFAIGAFALLAVFTPTLILNNLELSEAAKIIVTRISVISFFCRISLVACAVLCIIFQGKRLYLTRHPILTSTFAVAVSFTLSFGIMPTAIDLLVTPIQQIAASLMARHPPNGSCIRYGGPNSPNLSIAMGMNVLHNRCEPPNALYLIVPKWKAHECDDLQMKVLDEKSYLLLCGK